MVRMQMGHDGLAVWSSGWFVGWRVRRLRMSLVALLPLFACSGKVKCATGRKSRPRMTRGGLTPTPGIRDLDHSCFSIWKFMDASGFCIFQIESRITDPILWDWSTSTDDDDGGRGKCQSRRPLRRDPRPQRGREEATRRRGRACVFIDFSRITTLINFEKGLFRRDSTHF